MSELIAIITKNAREEIRVEITEFKGYDLLDIRVWTDPRDSGDQRIATKAGIACRINLLPALIVALREAELAARRANLLSECVP